MSKEVMINCPNCNKRTFAEEDKCIYCKFILKQKEHDFDKEIYDFLHSKYIENRNKAETIKQGINRYNMSMKKTKEVVDYIAE